MGFFQQQKQSLPEGAQRTFVKWNQGVGQFVEGTVQVGDMVAHPFPTDTTPAQVPHLVIEGSNGELYDLTATQKGLASAIIAADPSKGDFLRITHVENVPIKGRPLPMKKFEVTSEQAPSVWDETPAKAEVTKSESPF